MPAAPPMHILKGPCQAHSPKLQVPFLPSPAAVVAYRSTAQRVACQAIDCLSGHRHHRVLFKQLSSPPQRVLFWPGQAGQVKAVMLEVCQGLGGGAGVSCAAFAAVAGALAAACAISQAAALCSGL